MPESIFIGNFAKGLKTDRLPFNIDNDAFPTMFNFYSWRGRAKRKRGTKFLGQLERQIESDAAPDFTLEPWLFGPLALVGGVGNLITGPWATNTDPAYSLEVTSSITPGSISVVVGAETYTEPTTPDGTLIGTGGGTGTINYATGEITIAGGGVGPLTGTFSYFPGLPVMGLRDFDVNNNEITSPTSSDLYPVSLAFDTRYSYQVNQATLPVNFYNTTFFKNTNIPFVWSGADFQLFWTTNFSGALWATNNVPGFNFAEARFDSNPVAFTLRFFFTRSGVPVETLIINDVVWFNEFPNNGGVNPPINGFNGTVVAIVNAALGEYDLLFTSAIDIIAGQTGIVQFLTNTIPGQDGIKWYDGDPTGTTGIPTGTGLGWVNFAPPLTATTVSIDDRPARLYYLVGAQAILPFKDRLLFFSPWIQSSSMALPIQLIDTVLWSWNGTPYYNALVPAEQTFNPIAYYVDQTGLGGYLPAGISQPIKTVSNNEDVLLIGFGGNGRKTRFVYTGNDLQPFLFFNINSELPSTSTFSAVPLDQGVLDIGQYGIALTDQQSSQRVDLDIPDSVFQIQSLNNGADRVNAVRDFFREWIYFAYPVNNSDWRFPTQTFLFNYRDNTWAIFYENFTAHGNYRPQLKKNWQNLPYKTWNEWNEPWNSGSDSALFTQIIAGNPQGYVLVKGEGTGEAESGTIMAVADSGGVTLITSIDHCVKSDDFLLLTNLVFDFTSVITNVILGTTTTLTSVNTFVAGQTILINGILGTTELNGRFFTILSATGVSIEIDVDSTFFTPYISGGTAIFVFTNVIGKVLNVLDDDNFVIDIPFADLNPNNDTYLGLGKFTRLSQPLLQTKQFPVYWNEGRQVRLAVQKYLMDITQNSQITINIYLSQDPDDAWNDPLINVPPNSLVYSQILFTSPESTNLGLTPANINLQMPIGENQRQIWHRINTSLIGDTFQVGLTLSEEQMKNLTHATAEITCHGMQFVVERGPLLA